MAIECYFDTWGIHLHSYHSILKSKLSDINTTTLLIFNFSVMWCFLPLSIYGTNLSINEIKYGKIIYN